MPLFCHPPTADSSYLCMFTYLLQSPISMLKKKKKSALAIVKGLLVEKGWCKWEIGPNRFFFLKLAYFAFGIGKLKLSIEMLLKWMSLLFN